MREEGFIGEGGKRKEEGGKRKEEGGKRDVESPKPIRVSHGRRWG
jgi:hypothetical protein